MKHERRIPAWLLRDFPALAGMFACFWLFVIPFINEGFRIMRGGQPRPHKMTRLAHLLINAEATLAYAFWREAYRRLGYNHRLVKLDLSDLPASHSELMTRIRSYLDQIQNLSRVSAVYTELLSKRFGAASVPAAHGATGARRAARHEIIGLSGAIPANDCAGAKLSTARNARPATQAGVLAHARGPPLYPDLRRSKRVYLSAHPRLRSHPHACANL